jgi:hypothetical protein
MMQQHAAGAAGTAGTARAAAGSGAAAALSARTSTVGVTSGVGPVQFAIDERCVSLMEFLEVLISAFRKLELQLRHRQWAEDLFDSAMRHSAALAQANSEIALHPAQIAAAAAVEQRMDFASFQSVFALAEPRYTSREIASLFSNLTRSAGMKTLSRTTFTRLIVSLMGEGVMFPLLAQAGYAHSVTIRVVMRHWQSFQAFFEAFWNRLAHSEREADRETAKALKRMRWKFERELARASGSGIGGIGEADDDEDDEGNAIEGGNKVRDRAAVLSSLTRRLVSLYRGLLSCVTVHQCAAELASVETPVRALHAELKAMEHLVVHRQKVIDKREADQTWLKNLQALEVDERTADEDAEIIQTERPLLQE